MFVDNPVGTGFSFVDKARYLARDNHQIAVDLVQLYLGFLRENPKFKGVPLFVFSESYGAKMTAEFAYELYKVRYNIKLRYIDKRSFAPSSNLEEI